MLKEVIESSDKIVVLTGAGVSTDSGIPDFKSFDESWGFPIAREDAMSAWFFRANPIMFWEMYRYIFSFKDSVTPNRFHSFLSDLESTHQVLISTQNVDGLHQKAGSSNVVEFHGSAYQVICSSRHCRELYSIEDFSEQPVPTCPACGAVLKPNVSLFGEGVVGYGETRDSIIEADLLIVAGTALNVGPFNELPLYAQAYQFTHSLWVNHEPAPVGYKFDDEFVGSLSDFLKDIKY